MISKAVLRGTFMSFDHTLNIYLFENTFQVFASHAE